MSFNIYTPEIARKQAALMRATKEVAEAAGRELQHRKVFTEAVVLNLREQGLTIGRRVWHVQRDGKSQFRKITDLQVCFSSNGTASDIEIAVHMENPDNEFGALATLPNVHLRKGDYQFVPRPKRED